jgi:hypothetical protein
MFPMSPMISEAVIPSAARAADGMRRLSIRNAEGWPAPGTSHHRYAHHHPTAGGNHH